MSADRDDENLLSMTKNDLQRWIQAEVDRNPHLMQRREQLTQVEEWVKHRERETKCTRLLYSNACESVMECESVMKGLYGMLGLEYRDEDSEEEGGGGEPQDVIQIIDDDEEAERPENIICNGDDDDLVVIDLGATKDTLEPMLEKVTMAIQRSSKLVQDLVQMVSKTSSIGAASPSSYSDIANRPSLTSTPETSRSESVTPKLEITNSITIVKTESLLEVSEIPSLLNSSEQCKSIVSHNSNFKPSVKTEPELTPLTPWEKSNSKQYETAASSISPTMKLIKTEPQLTAVTPSEMIPNKQPKILNFRSPAKVKSEPELTNIKAELSSPPSISKLFEIHNSVSYAAVKTEPQLKASVPEMDSLESDSEQSDRVHSDGKATMKTELKSSAVASPEITADSEPLKSSVDRNSPSVALNETEPPVTPSETPLPSISSEPVETSACDNTASIETHPTEPGNTASIETHPTEPGNTASIETHPTEPGNTASIETYPTEPGYTASIETHPTEPGNTASIETNPTEPGNTACLETHPTEPKSTTDTPPEAPSSSEEARATASHDAESTESRTRSKSAKPSVDTVSPTTRLRSSKKPPATNASSLQKETTRAPSPTESIDEPTDMEDSPASPTNSVEPPKSSPESPTNTADETTGIDSSAKPSSSGKKSKTSSSKSSEASLAHKEIKLKVGAAVLGKKKHNSWSQGTVQEIQTEDSGDKYKVEFKKGKTIVLPAHHVAPLKPPTLKDLFIGCRVVASCKDEKGKTFYNAGVMVELPERKNRMRFLVFYDDGLATYLALPDLYIVCKQLKKVWRDIKDEASRRQVKEYLQVYPNPIAVVLRVGQDTKAVRNGKFEDCLVLQLDGSLIQICYKRDKEKEWIYKGSEKLEHIVNIKKRLAKEKPQKTHRSHPQKTQQSPQEKTQQPSQQKTLHPTKSGNAVTPSSTVANAASANVPSTTASPASVTPQSDTAVTKTQSISPQNIMLPVFQPKVVLQKISMPLSVLPAVSLSNSSLQTATSRTEYTTSNLISVKRPAPNEEDEEHFSEKEEHVSEKEEKKSVYLHHRCCAACVDDVRLPRVDTHHGKNPLLIPLLFKFRRMTARRRIDGKLFFHIFYRSPCGRSLCDMEEVQDYLLETHCDFLFLEMFCMDPFVLVNRARPPSTTTGQPHLFLPDISEGREVMPVPCVNEVDNTLAPNVTYTKDRVLAPGVFINTSSDFLIGCDCTDGCRDRSKCACHRLTIEATSLCSGGPVDVSAGYTHKRLPISITTGVYECNPLCRCDPRMCSNRLVQHGLQLRLELFMTQHKGWGIRCKDDVAKGTFVCVFTGKVVNEDKMNEDDTVSGNEYLANLDFIEGVEKLKEGYESEAYCSDTEVESNKKTITMKTGPLLKKTLYQEDSSSGEEGEEPMEVDTVEGKIKVCDKFEGEKKLPHTPSEALKDIQKKVTEQMRNDGQETSGPKRCFAIKSFKRRVKPLETTEKSKSAQPAKNTRRLFNDEEACYIIDARQEGNLCRYINHSCSPNLFVQNVFVDTHDLRFPWVAFFASKRIKAGTELTWDYNYEVGSVEGKVLLCCCGSLRCTGRLL